MQIYQYLFLRTRIIAEISVFRIDLVRPPEPDVSQRRRDPPFLDQFVEHAAEFQNVADAAAVVIGRTLLFLQMRGDYYLLVLIFCTAYPSFYHSGAGILVLSVDVSVDLSFDDYAAARRTFAGREQVLLTVRFQNAPKRVSFPRAQAEGERTLLSLRRIADPRPRQLIGKIHSALRFRRRIRNNT